MSAKKGSEISGWYGKTRVTEAERVEQMRQVEDWHQKRIDLNYRQIPVEAPGKMVLALGKMAQAKGVPFGDFVEGILADYLERQGVDWTRSEPIP
ncbi:MAG: hypothetical protein M1380_00110 [Chloroflexi bacterium]|nr:hypothetical protein [Chloroflexota bacterium]